MAIEILPSKLYKYRSLATAQEQDRVREIVLKNKIYFPSAKSFNDPFDLHPVFDLTARKIVQRKDYERLSKKHDGLGRTESRKAARQVMKTSMNPKNVAATTRAVQAEHARFITETIGVLCLSKKPDDILMWSHYGDSHKGVCLEFDGMSKFMAHAQEVKYAKVRDPIRPYSETQEQMMEKALLTKSCHWTYEDEYRLVRYAEGPGLVEFGPHNLTRIIVGANADKVTLDLVQDWIAERVEPIRLSRASVSKTKFEVLIDAVG